MAESKRISDLIAVEDISMNDLLLLSSFIDQDNYESRKAGLGLVALAMLSDFTFDDVLTTASKNIIGAINELKQTMQFQTGDEVSSWREIYTGIVTGGRRSLRFFIPCCKAIANNVSGINFSGDNWEIRDVVTDHYILSSGTLESLGAVSTFKTANGFMVEIKTTVEDYTTANNTPIAVYGGSRCKFTFN